MTANMIVAVPMAVLAAASFGLAGVLQAQATHQVPWRGAARPSLLVDLSRQPLWLASVVATLVGIVSQVIALRNAPLVFIQPLLVAGLLFAVVFGAALQRRRPDRVLLAGAGCCVTGLATFLLAARPSSGDGQLTLMEVFPLAAGLASALAVCLGLAKRFVGLPRSLALALATGVLYGVTAGLIKVVARDLDRGLTEPFQNWALYIVFVIGPLGFLLNQSAFQSGTIASPALAVITTTDPLVSIGIGLLWLGEHINASVVGMLAEIFALVVMAGGVAALAHRAPQVRGRMDGATSPNEGMGTRHG